MSFKRLTRHIVVGTVLAMATGGAWAGIANTKHNLGSTGPGPNKSAAPTPGEGTDEICVFCHTPHGATTGVSAPLWNKNVPLSNTFTTYATIGSSTLDSGVLAVGSVSIACLSCHDGAQAMNSMVNEPGSGTDTISFTNWQGVDTIAGIANLGKDLSNDHPIGVAYAGGGCGGVASTTCDPATLPAVRDKDFRAATQTSASSNQWFVDAPTGGVAGSRDKTDMILYARDMSTGGLGLNAAEPSVECGSCHDPHTETGLFLRRDGGNTESQVCLTCHTK